MNISRLCFWIVAATAIHYCATAMEAQVQWTPMQFRTVEGIRPFVPVELNGKPFLFMVHSNASFYAMTTHANASSAGVTDSHHDADFGIDAPGHVSSQGLTQTTAKLLKVGSSEVHDASLSLFEVPVPDMQGMLGIGWLRENGVLVDFDGQRLGFATAAEGRGEDARLIHNGFVAHAMTWEPAIRRYVVHGRIDGHNATLVVSTVGENILDERFAKDAGIAAGPVVYVDSGPKGAQVKNYLSKRPLRLTLDGQKTAWMQPILQDTYAYSSAAPPTNAASSISGYLGCDFMLANDAVIDFASSTLLLRVPTE